VQLVVKHWVGALLQMAVGDKGSSFIIVFGAPVAHYDDATRAVRAALALQSPPAELAFVTNIGLGLAHGPIRAGAYGSPAQRAYTVIGDKTNLAARLMAAAAPNTVLCDDAVHAAAQEHIDFESLGAIQVKGKSEPVNVYRPLVERVHKSAVEPPHATLFDQLTSAQQLALKTASVVGHVFSAKLLRDIYPDEGERQNVASHLAALTRLKWVAPASGTIDRVYMFSDAGARESAYGQMLFAQRRQLHRAIAEWHERVHADDLAPRYPTLARHWRAANEPARAVYYLELAAEYARTKGALDDAQRYLSESLTIDATASVLSDGYRA